jgi:hypothetical protein
MSFEDFEDGEAGTWTVGLESAGGGFTTFLGRLGKQNPEVSNAFPVPAGGGSVVLAFDVYSIDGYSSGDKAYVNIAGSSIDLGLFDGSGSGSGNFEDITVTKTESSPQNIGFSAEKLDQKFNFELTIPASWYTIGKLEIGFEVQMQEDTEETSVGIDNIRLTAVCEPQRRDLEQGVPSPSLPVSEPDKYAVAEGYYCSAEHFPCEGAGNVHVCHHDTRRGYHTFCVRESDSEVLRFYKSDYCGPCSRGYGGITTN